MTLRETLTRSLGIITVGARQMISRATSTAQKRVQLSILGVVVTIALLVVVTGIGIGLVAGTTVYDDDVDYWIVPESGGDQSPLVATDQPQFGSVHETHSQLRDHDEVTFSTPILTEILHVDGGDESEFVLVVGVVNSPDVDTVTGISTDGLTHDDPYYENGSYDGEWTGDVVLSQNAANILNVESGDSVTIAGNSSFSVSDTRQGESAIGDTPIALVQLSELQSVTGADTYDQADQFVVGTNAPELEDELAEIYPESSVLTRGELMATETAGSDLPLALALTAFVVAVSVGTLFVLTTTSLELVADKNQLATMSAIGISVRTQLRLIGVRTLVMTGIGGLVGSLVGLLGIRAVNWTVMQTLTTEPIAISHPLFIGYGIGAALLVGVLSLPFLFLLTRRVTGGVPE